MIRKSKEGEITLKKLSSEKVKKKRRNKEWQLCNSEPDPLA